MASRPFALFWLSQAINGVGDGFYFLALAWAVYEETGSTLALGGLVLVGLVVRSLAHVIVGPVADLVDRRRLLIALDLARGATTLAAAALLGAHDFPLWLPYALTVVNGILGLPYRPAATAMLPGMVPEAALARANAWFQGMFEGTYLVGPALAGFFVAAFGAAASLAVDSASFIASAAILAAVRYQGVAQDATVHAAGRRRPTRWLQEIRAGFAVLARDRRLRLLVALRSTSAFTDACYVVAVVPYVVTVLGGTAAGVGLLEGAMSAGIILAAPFAARPLWDRVPWLAWLGVPVFALCTAALAVAPSLPWAIALQVMGGIADGLFDIRNDLDFQRSVPDAPLGRTLMLQQASTTGAAGLGTAIAGALGGVIGIPLTFVVFGTAGLAASGVAVVAAAKGAATATPSRDAAG